MPISTIILAALIGLGTYFVFWIIGFIISVITVFLNPKVTNDHWMAKGSSSYLCYLAIPLVALVTVYPWLLQHWLHINLWHVLGL